MRALRILLQLVILGAGGITLAALISRPDPDLTAIVGFLGFAAFLLALTLALKEHNEKRIVMLHSFVKKTQKTPLRELRTAQARMKEIKNAHA